MAEVKWIRIPTDFFESEPIASLEDFPQQDELTVMYLKLLADAYKHSRKGIITIANCDLDDDAVNAILRNRYDGIGERLNVLEDLGLIKREAKSIQVFKFWEDKRDRNSLAYKEWRSAVFKRDGYRCAECGSKKLLQAHHIKSWKSCKEGRYQVENGTTLCRVCHLKAHGGCWKNG